MLRKSNIYKIKPKIIIKGYSTQRKRQKTLNVARNTHILYGRTGSEPADNKGRRVKKKEKDKEILSTKT